MNYQLKVELEESHPSIWRRVLVPADLTFDDLHIVVQIVMGWENAHLYQFHFGRPFASDYIGLETEEDLQGPNNGKHFKYDSQELTLEEYFGEGRKHVNYVYDFGDNWSHTITLEATNPDDYMLFPSCMDGAETCPPEDCGGIAGYYDWLKIIKNPNHPSYLEYREWQGLEPEEDYETVFAFDKKETNETLVEVFSGETEE